MLATAHATIGAVTGLGRPRDLSKPLAHAYITGMVGEFQGFARDLNNLTVQRLIDASAADPRFVSVLTEGLTRGRALDRNNSDLRTIKADFGRLGLSPLDLGVHDARWSSNDSNELPLVFNLRNALAHGNEAELRTLRSSQVQDTVAWARRRLPVLNRVAKSLDHLVWDHLHTMIGTDPWR